MFFKKNDLPDSNDFVICTVKKILHHSVFVNLDEYENLEGLIHISEIAPGRIRNIRDFVKPDKKIVCKVLKVNKENRQVDLSLRRVSINSMKIKLDENRQEEKAEKLIEFVGKQLKMDLDKTYKEIGLKIIENFGSLKAGFDKISLGNIESITKLNINKNFADILFKVIKDKIKLPKIKSRIVLELKSYNSNGIELIKGLLMEIYNRYKKKGYELNISYISAPKYQIEVTTTDKKNSKILAENLALEIVNEGKKINIISQYIAS